MRVLLGVGLGGRLEALPGGGEGGVGADGDGVLVVGGGSGLGEGWVAFTQRSPALGGGKDEG